MPSSPSVSRKNVAREYSRGEKAASRETSPPVFATYETRFGQVAFVLLWLVALLAPYAFSGFAAATQDVFEPPAPIGPLTGQSLFCAMTTLAAFFVALMPRLSREYSRVEKIAVGALGVFFALTCASVLVAAYRYDALLEAVRIGCVVAWFFLARAILLAPFEEEIAPPRVLAARGGALLFAIALGAALVAALAIYGFLKSGSARQASTFYNNNLLANYCAMAAPLCLACAISAWRGARREYSPLRVALIILAVATFFTTLGGLLITASKGGFLALLIALLVFAAAVFGARRAALLRFVKARRILVASIAAVVLLGGGALAMKTVVPRLLAARTTDDNSTMFRVYTWRGTLKMAQEKPLLGWGAGAFPSTYSTRFGETGYTRSAHQSWLQIAAESGIPSLLALLLSFGAACACGARGLRGASWESAAGGLAALAALLAHGFVDSGWGITSIAFLAMISAALLSVSEAENTRTSPEFVKKDAAQIAIAGEPKNAGGATKFAKAEDARRNEKATHTASTREMQNSGNIRWDFMALALIVAGAAWWMQQVVGAQDIIREDRARIAQNQSLEGGIDGALTRASDALAQNGGNAALHQHRAKLLESANQDALAEYEIAAQLRPNFGNGWRALAQYLARRGQTQRAAEMFARAANLDPKNTALLWDYAEFQLKQNDARGYETLRKIVAQRDAPYGRYPALGDFINLDFARAALILAPRENNAPRRAALLQMAQRDLKAARAKQDYVVNLAASNYGPTDIEAPQDLDELENKARILVAEKS